MSDPDRWIIRPDPARRLLFFLRYGFATGFVAFIGVVAMIVAVADWRGPLPLLGAVMILGAAVALVQALRHHRDGIRRADRPWYLRELGLVALGLALFVGGAFVGSRG